MGVGMVFGIIFTIVVIGLILVFGSSVIVDIMCLGSDAQVQKTIQNMEKFVDDLYILPSGSGDYFTINIPGNTKLCIINSTNPKKVFYPEPEKTWNPDKVYQKIIYEEGYNVWFEQCSGKGGATINHLFMDPDKNFCVKSGTMLYLKNVGRYVAIVED